jgi:MFS superfamily sulfate permease-like transporter
MLKFSVYLAIIGVILLVVLLFTVPAFAVLGETLVYIAIILFLFWLFDKKILKEVDTINELKNNNIAYALFLVAIALLFLAVAIIVG